MRVVVNHDAHFANRKEECYEEASIPCTGNYPSDEKKEKGNKNPTQG